MTNDHTPAEPDPGEGIDLVAQLETAVKDSYRNGYTDGLADAKISDLRVGRNPFALESSPAESGDGLSAYVRVRRTADNVFPPFPPFTLALTLWIIGMVEPTDAVTWAFLVVAGWLALAILVRVGIYFSVRRLTNDGDRDGTKE